MDIAKNAASGDKTFEQDGLKVYLEKNADSMLDAATIDHSDERGFIITGQQASACSPSAGGSCRC